MTNVTEELNVAFPAGDRRNGQVDNLEIEPKRLRR